MVVNMLEMCPKGFAARNWRQRNEVSSKPRSKRLANFSNNVNIMQTNRRPEAISDMIRRSEIEQEKDSSENNEDGKGSLQVMATEGCGFGCRWKWRRKS
jgi:ABC-type Fe3+/spermidine/putrescine transport system ATPase subunit